MKKVRKKYTESQILAVLRDAEATGNVEETLRRHGVNDSSYYRWKAKYADMSAMELARMRELEKENQRLRKLVADQALDISILKDINSKNW
jgi:Transposase.